MLPFCRSHSDADTALLWLTSVGREERRDVHVCIWGMKRGDDGRGLLLWKVSNPLQLLIQLPRIFLPYDHYYYHYHPYYPTSTTTLLQIMLLQRTMIYTVRRNHKDNGIAQFGSLGLTCEYGWTIPVMMMTMMYVTFDGATVRDPAKLLSL